MHQQMQGRYNQGSKESPSTTTDETKNAQCNIKKNRAPDMDRMVIEP